MGVSVLDAKKRILKLIKYGVLTAEFIDDAWLMRLMKENRTSFKARVWLVAVHRLASIDDTFDLATYYPRVADLVKGLDREVLGAYMAWADGDDVQMVARTIGFGIYCSALARELTDIDIVDKLLATVTPDEYELLINRYLQRVSMGGIPKIIADCLMRIQGDCFYDFKERAYVFSQAILAGEEALVLAKQQFVAGTSFAGYLPFKTFHDGVGKIDTVS